ncbi:sugar ABC transporter permease [Roseomonas sp. HJA6]|uniref:Sugar ABC transporter permease n=1 Tax=Roseomonas alba TaxID=2846776 RepID=A0ABS7AEX5_9PROT|nr:sugar ABC transporter permease [Neoroseomonas alba]MBW6400861.1 sugar ABC transporter permease [Neoroseomonas alba]
MRASTRLLVVLLAPSLVLFALLTLYPLLRVLLLAFTDSDYGFEGADFVGLANFAELAEGRGFRRAAWNTVAFAVMATVGEVVLGLALALLLDRAFRGRRLVTLVLLAPYVLSTIVVGAIWRAWFHYDVGFLNTALRGVGLPGVPWLFDPVLALPSIALADLWQATPFCFLILYAGLRSIPPDLHEAARIDGAGTWARFRDITLPLLWPYILIAGLMRTLDSFKLFDKVYAMTGGGPGNATETLSMFVQRLAFRFFDIGMASAAALVMVVVAGGLAAIYARQLMRPPA